MFVRYAAVSAVTVPVTQVALIAGVAGFDLAPVTANVIAVTVGAVPSYVLNRAWVWRKRGPSHLWREVVPFWLLSLVGLAVSSALVALATAGRDSAIVASLANLTAYAALWVGKFVILHNVLFQAPTGTRSLADDAPLDPRAG